MISILIKNCRRLISIGMVVLGILSLSPLFAGEVVENKSYTGPKTTIRYSLWGGSHIVEMNRMISERFVEEHPDIAVESSVYPWGQYWAKLQTQAASGLAPDVISVHTAQVGVWINHGALMSLNELVEQSGLDLDRYYRSAINNFIWDDQLYAFPLEIAVAGLVYSIDRLEERGIPPEEWPRPDEVLSWEEFKSLARKLTLIEPDGTVAQYGMTPGNLGWNWVMVRLFGGDYLDRQVDPTRTTVLGNEELAKGIIEIYRSMYGDRFHAPRQIIDNAGFGGESVLLSSRFAMNFAGPWALPSLQENGVRFGISPPPHGPSPSQLISVNAVGVYSGSKHPQAAWKFIQFMASEEIQPIFGQRLRGVPALKEARDGLINNDYGIPGCEAYLADLDISVPFISCPNTYVPTAIDKWNQELERELENEYDDRLFALQEERGGILDESDYDRFVEQMDSFVEESVRARLPQLHQDMEDGFERARRPMPGLFVQRVMPVIILAALAACAVAYIVWIRRREQVVSLSQRSTNWWAYLCLSPWLFGFVFFTVGPIVASLMLSFTEWNMIKAPIWIGAQHYADLFSDRYFSLGLQKTFTYAAFVIPISLIGGITTAGLLTSNVRGADAFKAIFYFPSLFTGAAAAILWVNMFNKEFGVVNRFLDFVGIAPVNWLDGDHAFFTVVLMNFFWIGGATIIYYAGMKQIPRTLYEAAEIDGAGAFRRFFNITIPMLSPVILFMVVMTTIGAFQIFTPALFFAPDSRSVGAPADALRFYSVNIYDEAFNNLHMGKACSWAVILFVIIFAVTMLQFKLSKRFVHTEG